MNLLFNPPLFLNKNHSKYLQVLFINFLLVFIFTLLYYIDDYMLTFYKKTYYNLHLIKDIDYNFNLKPIWYYLWFSLSTQTTVGYAGIIKLEKPPKKVFLDSNENNSSENTQKTITPFEQTSVIFKIINIIQLFSLFITPFLVFFIE